MLLYLYFEYFGFYKWMKELEEGKVEKEHDQNTIQYILKQLFHGARWI